ncbi:serine hydrolase [Viridibacillus sp. YIM B01967]|uniref:Serine hydrolase n=1 Tax=Viridibacillus soli TaxID=2798301 RepID=A0ABS1H6D9_9BACL|nr:serine hydrolase [Viridibacillus soli]MBK3494955.1 serine hydrolase [Viridibacillus soli]
MKQEKLLKKIQSVQQAIPFSGTIFAKQGTDELASLSYGYANRSEKIENEANTKYGIASGCKIFTAIAICQLVEKGELSFESKLKDCLAVEFPYFDENITVHHLLSHTSGVPDYFDEEVMDDFEELWIKTPMYHIRRLQDFLPLFQQEQMKYPAGAKFQYNNSGYILLGLIIEQMSGISFSEYVEKNIFQRASMQDSGYFEMDALPAKTAVGYIDHADGSWKTNIYSLPVKGGSDGGAYVTATDMMKLWEALTNFTLLSQNITTQMLTPYAHEEDGLSYGYGIWIETNGEEISKYLLMGYDPGVNFHAAFYPKQNRKIVVCVNTSEGAYDMISGIEEVLSSY